MRELVATLGPRTRDALGALLPGPVTLVVANPEHRYPLACREDPERLGVRLIEGALAGAACAVFQTSANRSGEPAPSRFEDVDPGIVAAVDLAIDGGELTGQPSTVVDLTAIEDGGEPEILREGALSRPSSSGSSELYVREELEPHQLAVDDRRDRDRGLGRLDPARLTAGADHELDDHPAVADVLERDGSRLTESITSRNEVHQRRTPSGPR